MGGPRRLRSITRHGKSSVALGEVYGEKPAFGQDDASRIRDVNVLGEITDGLGEEGGGSVLLVTHGDAVG